MDATALYKFQSGLYVVSAATEDDYGACVINTGLQVTAQPLQVMVAVNKQNHTQGVIAKAGHFALCPITEEADMPYIGRFGFRTSTEFAKFEGIEKAETVLGDPYTPVAIFGVVPRTHHGRHGQLLQRAHALSARQERRAFHRSAGAPSRAQPSGARRNLREGEAP
ncbi:MAG: flavin reductase, partial [Atopobiaceae bacterium]|nr:flavin reductase [Atopobiaceae bacterium]